jgi:hypothetical protein
MLCCWISPDRNQASSRLCGRRRSEYRKLYGMPPPRPELDREATAKAFQRALPKIGLKLEPAMGAGMFLVIYRIERPTEN